MRAGVPKDGSGGAPGARDLAEEREGDELLALEVTEAHHHVGGEAVAHALGDRADALTDVRHPIRPLVGDDGCHERGRELGVVGVVRDHDEVDVLVRLLAVLRALVGVGVGGVHVGCHQLLDRAHEAGLVMDVHAPSRVTDFDCRHHCPPWLGLRLG